MKWYVDTSFVANKDMRIHASGSGVMGTQNAYVQDSKNKLNTKSSTEANVFRVDDLLTQDIWNR